MDDQPQAPPLPDHYRAQDKGEVWHLWCHTCHHGFALVKAEVDKPGRLAGLLNHAASHEARAKEAAEVTALHREQDRYRDG